MNVVRPLVASGVPSVRGRGVTAMLGPTNTGKTHLAIERMIAHPTGLIGLPLRLLAREVYNRLVARCGADRVALVTGEEKIKPPNARYWVATVEAMPRDLDFDFVAIDEIQLAADLDRGHVFTDRILNLRGRHETLLLGAGTMRGLVERLLPGVSIIGRPRLSTLSFAGEKKITRLPRRTAIVAFSAQEVYAIAELIRRQSGGAAVVLGALSPRTRNAQVALYQAGDVDYLIATDAIGMGLNLDVDHVAFAGDRKFDGFQFRRLNPTEFAQIAGRAGRHLTDGTFGTTGRCPPMETELVQRLEAHEFEPTRLMQWRSSVLDMTSIEALKDSLDRIPTEPGLTRAPVGDDIQVLETLSRDADIRSRTRTAAQVQRLWEVCQVPDYRKISPNAHAELAATLYGFLAEGGRIPTDWFARQVAQSDRAEGDIDTLSARIAHIRTWTFVANRPDWLGDPDHWQDVTRSVEDKLSDALHERLAQRFVDRRTSVLMRRLRERTMLEAEITADGDVRVEGHNVGRLAGFQFTPDPSAEGQDVKALRAAAQQVLSTELEVRAARMALAPDSEFVLAADGIIRWLGDTVARLVAGDRPLVPRFRIVADEQIPTPAREKVEHRLDLWIRSHVQKLLGPLIALESAPDLEGLARGVAFQLVEALGVLDRSRVADDVKALDQTARAALRAYGIRFGAYHIYLPALLKPAPRALAAQLYALHHGGLGQKGLDEIPHLAASGRTSFPVDKDVPKGLYRALGYRASGERAVRVDILERLADLIRPALAWRPGNGEPPPGAVPGGFTVTVGMTSLVGCSGEDFASILRSLGYRMELRPVPAPQPVARPTAAAPAEAVAEAPAAGPEAAEAAAPAAAAAEEAPAVTEAVTAVEAGDAELPIEQPGVSAIEQIEPVEAAAEAAAPVEAPAVEAPVEAVAEAAPAAEVAEEAAPVELPAADAVAAAETEPAEIAPAEVVAVEIAPVEVAPVEAAAVEAAPAEAAVETAVTEAAQPEAAAAPAEPAMVEVWRPGGRPEGARRPQQRGAEAREGGGPRRDERREQQGRPGGQPHRRPQDGQDNGERRGERGDRPRGGRDERRPRFEGGRSEGPRAEGQENRRPNEGRDGGDRRQQPQREQRRPERQPDPSSPFAALLALKAKLEADKGKSR